MDKNEEKLPSHLSLRHPTQEMLDQIDAIREASGFVLTRSDVIRSAILRGLRDLACDLPDHPVKKSA